MELNDQNENLDSIPEQDAFHTKEYSPAELKKRKRKKRRIVRKRIARRIGTLFLICVLAAYVVVGIYGTRKVEEWTKTIPTLDVKDLMSEESSYIYDANGKLITEIGTYYRQNITYDQCPESLVDAVLAIEDSRYFEHNGFDIPRFTKSVIETLVRHNQQGGSTFTMQLVKNSYFSIDAGDESVERSATVEYKVQQILLSMQLETQLNKREIFELYMNKLNFGDRVRGVQKASQYYFGKNVWELTLSESALLAGIINMPNGYNPYHYLDQATTRRNEVLDLMYLHGYIDQSERALAKSIRVEDQLVGVNDLNVESQKYAQYIDVVIEEAQKMTGRDPVIYGMKIYTALNPTVQSKIEGIENGSEGIPFTKSLMQTAIISMNNQNGEIVGIGGGRGYQGGARLLNRATAQYKQPGSTVKPILSYALAFEYLGYSLDEVIMDKPTTFPGESRQLSNAGNDGFSGDVTIKKAIGMSLNIPAILTLEKVTARIGGQGVVDYLHNVGFTRASNANYHMSYAIGGNAFEATVAELAGAASVMFNGGVYNKPHTIRQIEMSDGDVYYPENQNNRVISSGSAYLVTQLMKNNVDDPGIMSIYMNALKRSYPVYAKTGTSDWGSDGVQYGIPVAAMKDKWMICATSNYTNAVWVGFDKAVNGAGTYFTNAEGFLNIPGRICSALLSAEEQISGADLSGVKRPSDVMDVTYAYGTYPHITSGPNMITSQVSTTGYNNTPSVESSAEMVGFGASMSNGILYINWGGKKGCNQGTQDISLHDNWNDVQQSGACLVSTTWAYGNNPTFMAAIYVDGKLHSTVTSKDSQYGAYPGINSGVVTVCGWYSNGKTTSNQQCAVAYDFNTNSK